MVSRSKLHLAATNALRFFYIIAVVTVLQRYLGSLGASPFQISLLETVWWVGILFISPLWGAVSDLTGRRKPFLAASILLSAATVPVYGYITDTGLILSLKFATSILAAGFPPIALAMASEYGGQETRGRNMSVFNASKSVGFILGRIGAGLLLSLLAFTQTFWWIGGIGLIALISSLFLTPDGDGKQDATLRSIIRESKRRLIPSRSDTVLQQNGLIYLLTGIAIRKAGTIGMYSLIIVYMTTEKGISDLLMGILIALNPLAQSVFMLVFGNMTDRIGRKTIFSLGFLLSIPVPIVMALATGPLSFAAGFLLLGFSFSALASGSTAFIGDVAPHDRQAELLGIRKTAQGIAGVTGSLTAGIAAAVLGYKGMLFTMSGLMSIGFVVAYLGTTETFTK